MFKFNFQVDETELDPLALKENTEDKKPEDKTIAVSVEENEVECGILTWQELIELNRAKTYDDSDEASRKRFKKTQFNEEFIEYISADDETLKDLLKSDSNLNEINKTHDVVTGKYEGGLKIWECSLDLAKFLYSSFKEQKDNNEASQNLSINILELGCGHALPVLSLLKFFSFNINSIYLQDFNRECLETITFVNVKNFFDQNPNSNLALTQNDKIKFCYGDWKNIYEKNLLPANYFHLILSSETIYNCVYYKSLLNLFKQTIRINLDNDSNENNKENDDNERDKYKFNLYDLDKNACILLAAKTYYFGCGGNLLEFIKAARVKEYNFKCSKNLLISNGDNSIVKTNDVTSASSSSETSANQQKDEITTKSSANGIQLSTSEANSINVNYDEKKVSNIDENQSQIQVQNKSNDQYMNISREIIKMFA